MPKIKTVPLMGDDDIVNGFIQDNYIDKHIHTSAGNSSCAWNDLCVYEGDKSTPKITDDIGKNSSTNCGGESEERMNFKHAKVSERFKDTNSIMPLNYQF